MRSISPGYTVLVMMVDSMVAISFSPDSRIARTSPVQKDSLLPARRTDALARNRLVAFSLLAC